MKRTAIISAFAFLLFASLAWGQPPRPFTFDDLISIQRVSDPQVSPDGRWVAYVVTVTDKTKNTRNSDIWLVPIEGGMPRQLTNSEKSDDTPRWSPDGEKIAFVSTRDGQSQIWMIDVEGGEAKKITALSTGASGVIWSPDGKYLAFVSDIYPDCRDDDCNRQRNEAREASPVKARVLDRLLYRHWNTWREGKRRHLFVVPATGGKPWDLTPGEDYDVPPFALGGPGEYAFSPDGQEVCFVRNTDKVEAISTNNDLWTVPTTGGPAKRITTNPAADNSPLYSPDGRYIAYRAQFRAGFESDRWRLMLYDRHRGQHINLTENFDRSPEGFVWSPDSKTIYFTAEDEGYSPVFAISVAGGPPKPIIDKSFQSDVQITPNGRTLVFARQSLERPVEIYRASVDGQNVVQLTHTNDALLDGIAMSRPEYAWYTGAAGAKIQTWILKPPGFEATKKYPMLLLVHGGPQSAWNDVFHYRWNAQVFAGAGYVVLMPNPRGSTGFGQKFIDEISGDWGGKVYEDLMKGVDYALTLGYVDKERLGAAGASYGGYMINWIEGHTDRFKAVVSHAGAFNLTSKYGATEELWFPEWEFKGTPWTNKALYEKWSPHNFVQNFKTPCLVTHGELDFRVPIGEGLQMFTALQRMNVPSKMLYFPDEGHWILKPQNSEFWYKSVLQWFDQWLKPAKAVGGK